MRTTLLLVCWVLSGCLGNAVAQVPSAGPWRVEFQLVRVRRGDLLEEDSYYYLRNPVSYQLPSEDTAAVGRNPLGLETATENAAQDSAKADYDDWGILRHSSSDTTTVLRTKRIVAKASWNVNPNTITLFLACENPLTAPPRKARIRFTATGATLRLDTKQHLLWLAPSAPTVVLRAYRGQRLVFRHAFKAVEPPMPVVKVYVGSKDATQCKGFNNNSGFVRTITLRAIPDVDFATFMPEDARYRVAQFIVTPIRQGEREAPPTINGPQGDLSILKFKGEQGDQLQVDVQLVQRQNFQLKVSNMPLQKCFVLSDSW